MCTVTFIPRPNGYFLAMNRDEKLTRIAGLPPEQRILNGRTVICPSEPGGGTWISLNDCHVSFALINWYSVAGGVTKEAISRGEVVNALSGAVTIDEAESELVLLSLHRINPFRLLGVFPDARRIAEWRWNLNTLVRKNHLWKSRQWISSGFDEPVAQRVRGKTFQAAKKQRSAGTLGWLRRLHSSHSPESGPFSTCMHRSDAATVSYTEIDVDHQQSRMRYEATSPCETNTHFAKEPEWESLKVTRVHIGNGHLANG